MSTVTPTRAAPPPPRPASAPRTTTPMNLVARVDPFRVLRRHLVLIIGSVVLGAVLGGIAHVLLLRLYPLYRGEVFFEVSAGLRESTDIGANDLMQDELVFRLAKTETILLTSRDVLLEAVTHPETQKTRWFQKGFVDEDGTPLVQEAVDDLEEDLVTSVVRGTNLFNVSWSTHYPMDVPIVLSKLASAYIAKREQLDEAVYQDSKGVFKTQLNNANQELEDLNLEIQQFIRERGIEALESTRYSQTMFALQQLTSQITATSQELSLAQSSLAQTSQKLMGQISPTSEDRLTAENDPALASHIRAVLDLKTELRVLREKYQPDEEGREHQQVRETESRLRAVEAERDAKIEEIMTRNLQAQYKVYSDAVQRNQKLLEELELEAEAKRTSLRELAADQSEYEAKEMRRKHLETARDDIRQLIQDVELMRLRKQAERVRIAQPALKPREVSFPRVEVMVPLGAVIALVSVVGLIFLRELTDQRIRSASDLSNLPMTSVLGVIPERSEDPIGCDAVELVVRRRPNSVLAESYRQAFTPICRGMDRAGFRSLMLVGTNPDSGTTTAVTNIGAAAAAAGKRVVVVDANLRRPRLAEAMGVTEPWPGLGELLAGAAVLEETIVPTEYDLHVIGAGMPESRVFERLNNGQIDRVISDLCERFDLVLFDAPPAVVAGDAMVLANRVDACVLVVRAQQEKYGLVVRLVNQLLEAQSELLGVLLNRPRGTAGGYFKTNYSAMARYAAGPAD